MLLLESIRDEDERVAYVTVITEIASRFGEYEVVDIVKECLMDTEVGLRIRDEGKKEGLRDSLLVILLYKFDSLPDYISHAIMNEQNESILIDWIRKAICHQHHK